MKAIAVLEEEKIQLYPTDACSEQTGSQLFSTDRAGEKLQCAYCMGPKTHKRNKIHEDIFIMCVLSEQLNGTNGAPSLVSVMKAQDRNESSRPHI